VKEIPAYFISADSWGDGKSVCLWRRQGVYQNKIARFQSDAAAKFFAQEFEFPLSDKVQARLEKAEAAK
jgi:hypothetical protein